MGLHCPSMDVLMISIVNKGWESVKVHYCPMLRSVNDLKTPNCLIQLFFFLLFRIPGCVFYAQLTEIELSALQGYILEQKIHDQPPHTPLLSWTPSLVNYSNEAGRVMGLAAYYANFTSLLLAVATECTV